MERFWPLCVCVCVHACAHACVCACVYVSVCVWCVCEICVFVLSVLGNSVCVHVWLHCWIGPVCQKRALFDV